MELPEELVSNIISFLPLEDIINMRLVSQNWKNYVEHNLKYFYICLKSRNQNMPRVIFTGNFINNIKEYKIGIERKKRNLVLKRLQSYNQEQIKIYLYSFGIKNTDKISKLNIEFIERYIYLREKGENNYTCHNSVFSEWDDKNILTYLLMRRKGETPHVSSQLIDFNDNQLRKFLFLKEKGESSYTSELVVRDFDNRKISIFLYLRSIGVQPYSSKTIAGNFNENQIVKFLFLLDKGLTPYYAESIVSKLNEEKMERFLICLDHGLTENESKQIIEKLTRGETHKFLNLKTECLTMVENIVLE